MDYFRQFANTSLQDAQAKIRALEQQLQAQRHTTSNNQLPVVDTQEQDLTMTPESTTTPQANHDQHTPPTAPNNGPFQLLMLHNQLPRNQEHGRTWASKHAALATLLVHRTTSLPAAQATPFQQAQSPTYRTTSTTYRARTPSVLSPQQHQTQSQPRQLTLGLKNSQFLSNTKQHFTMP